MSSERHPELPDPDAARQAITEVPSAFGQALGPHLSQLARAHAESLRPFVERLGLRPVEKRHTAVRSCPGS